MKQALLFFAGYALATITWAALVAINPPAPRLVGFGCFGASGPLYAEEESDFPLCEEIKEVQP